MIHWAKEEHSPTLCTSDLGKCYIARCKAIIRTDEKEEMIDASGDAENVTCPLCLELLMDNIKDLL